jgi:signal transduction histidine kinase
MTSPRHGRARVATDERRRPLRLLLITVGGLAAVVALGALDRATPHIISLAVLYVIAVLAITMLAGLGPGLVTAAASAVAWSVGDAGAGELDEVGLTVLNGALRFLALAIVAGLVHRLARAVEESRRAANRSREFLAIAAHQLRTPIASVQASADALLGTEATPTQEQLLATLSTESARLGRLIGSLLRVARLDQGEMVRRESVDLGALAREEAERARRRGVTTIEVDEDHEPVVVLADADALREAIANLLDNARRHAVGHIQLLLGVEDGWGTVVVRDDGPGLPAGSEQRAFDRFVSLDGRGGAGLGLPIARGLVELMGGDLRYSGRAFQISLPLSRPAPAVHRADAPTRAQVAADPGGPRE